MSRSRRNRANNIGMHIAPGPSRFYGICPICGRDKPMHWISAKEYRCYDCLKGRQVEKVEPKPDNPYSDRKRFVADPTYDEITKRQLKRIRERAEKERQRIIRKKQKESFSGNDTPDVLPETRQRWEENRRRVEELERKLWEE